VKHALTENTMNQTRYEKTLAFMWESNKVWIPTSDALTKLMDADYVKCWDNIPKTFNPSEVPPDPHPLPFAHDRQVKEEPEKLSSE
jgi:homogentisate 1,2-dioxygenase